MRNSIAHTKAKAFAVRIVKFAQFLQNERKEHVLSKQLIALTAHGLHQDGQMHFATACHVEGIGAVLGDMERNVLQKLLFQTVTEVTGGDKFALLAGKGRIVHRKGHFDGGVRNLHKGQGIGFGRIAQSSTNRDVRHTA